MQNNNKKTNYSNTNFIEKVFGEAPRKLCNCVIAIRCSMFTYCNIWRWSAVEWLIGLSSIHIEQSCKCQSMCHKVVVRAYATFFQIIQLRENSWLLMLLPAGCCILALIMRMCIDDVYSRISFMHFNFNKRQKKIDLKVDKELKFACVCIFIGIRFHSI